MKATISPPENKSNISEENISFSYTMGIPTVLLEDPNLTDRQFRLMIHLIGLARKEGYCWASDEYLANKLGVSVSQIQRELLELEKNEWLVRKTVKEGMISVRSIYVAPAFSKKPYEYAHMSTSSTHTRAPRVRTGELPIYKASNILNKKKKKESPNSKSSDVPLPSLLSFGEFQRIKLTQQDYNDLEKRFGKQKLENLITAVDGNLEERGITRKSYKATILNWERREKIFNPKAKKEDIQEKNKAYAQEVVKTLKKNLIPKGVKLYVNSSYIELGDRHHPTATILQFSENGFKDQLKNELRRMNLIKYLT